VILSVLVISKGLPESHNPDLPTTWDEDGDWIELPRPSKPLKRPDEVSASDGAGTLVVICRGSFSRHSEASEKLFDLDVNVLEDLAKQRR
jgi:hypothetical protein